MRVLLTGATGKVGNAVAKRLVDRGDEVVAVVRNPEAAREVLGDPIRLVGGDVTNAASLRAAAGGIDAAINCMGIFEQWVGDDSLFEQVNAIGALNVIAVARQAGAKRAVHTSTFDVFHAERGGTVTEAAVADYPKDTAYERSKQRAEELVLGEGAHGIEVVIINPASVFGPGPWQQAGLDGMIRDAVRGRLPAVTPGGMTLAYVDDVAQAHVAALDRGRPGERYIVADGYASLSEIAAAAVKHAGRGRAPRTIPWSIARALSAGGEALSRVRRKPPLLPRGQLEFLRWEARADSSKAQAELGVDPTPWSEGIRRTIAWMEQSDRI